MCQPYTFLQQFAHKTESPSCVLAPTGIEVVANSNRSWVALDVPRHSLHLQQATPSFWELPINVSNAHQHDKMTQQFRKRNIYVAIRKQSFTIFHQVVVQGG